MSPHVIVYASLCVIPPAYAAAQIDDLVAKARHRNASLGITGALIYSERHFAQAIEGEEADLNQLMESISRDPRHKDLVILEQAPIARRRFQRWSLGYSGPSVFVDQIIVRAIYEADRASNRGLVELMRFMEDFASVDS